VGPPRGLLKHPEGPGQFYHARIAPSPELASLVQHFWIVRWDLRGLESQRPETLPHPNVHLVIDRNEALVHGVHTGRFVRELTGKGGVLGVKFRPGGFRPFLGGSVSRLRNRTTALAAIFDESSDALCKAVEQAGENDEQGIAVVQQLLLRRWPDADPLVDRVARIAADIEQDRSITQVEDLLERHAITRRSIQRLFNEYVGVGPKWVINRYRLHEVVERLKVGGQVDWMALALELGYFDQAHFNRDFKALIGRSPSEYAALR
jgi:AraC-like DNA-binding protein